MADYSELLGAESVECTPEEAYLLHRYRHDARVQDMTLQERLEFVRGIHTA